MKKFIIGSLVFAGLMVGLGDYLKAEIMQVNRISRIYVPPPRGSSNSEGYEDLSPFMERVIMINPGDKIAGKRKNLYFTMFREIDKLNPAILLHPAIPGTTWFFPGWIVRMVSNVATVGVGDNSDITDCFRGFSPGNDSFYIGI